VRVPRLADDLLAVQERPDGHTPIRRTTRDGHTYARVWCEELGMYAWQLEQDDKPNWPVLIGATALFVVTCSLLATLGVAMLKLSGVM
jgi:hypothetical protein